MTSIKMLYNQYITLSKNYSRLAEKCKSNDTDKQHQRLMRLQENYIRSYNNYQTALNSIFDENDAKLDAIKTDIQEAQAKIESMFKRISAIDDALDTISSAINLGSRLAKLGKAKQ